MNARQLPVCIALLFGIGCSAPTDNASPYMSAASGAGAGGAAGFGAGGAAAVSGGSGGSSSSGSGGMMAGPGQAGAAGTGGGGGGTGGVDSTGSSGSAGNAGVAGGVGGAAGGSTAPSEGQALYDASCKICHGAQGVGTAAAPELQHPIVDYATWVVRNGRAQTTFPMPMAKFAKDKLTDAQLTLIFQYLSLPPQPSTAQALFGDYCANCHGPKGEGGPSSRPLSGQASNVNTRVRKGSNVGQYSMRHDSMPVFSTTVLTDAELKLLHDYVGSL